MKKITFFGLAFSFDCGNHYMPYTHSHLLFTTQCIISVSSHTPSLIRLMHIVIEILMVCWVCRRYLISCLITDVHHCIDVLSAPISVLLVLAISTMWVQILFSFPNGQILYHNDIMTIICCAIFVPAVYAWIKYSLLYCMPNDALRKCMLTGLLIVAPILAIAIPLALLLTGGDVAYWDAALSVPFAVIVLMHGDPRVNPRKVKRAATAA